MKNKVLVGVTSVCVILGGALAVGAANKNFGADDSNRKEDLKGVTNTNQTIPEISEGQSVELETEHGHSFYKVETEYSNDTQTSNTASISQKEAAEIATNEVNGTITKIEMEEEHGRLEYKFEIQTSTGESDVRVDAETGEITRIKHDNDKKDNEIYDKNGNDDRRDQ